MGAHVRDAEWGPKDAAVWRSSYPRRPSAAAEACSYLLLAEKQSHLDGFHGGLAVVGDAELLDDALDVGLDRGEAQHEYARQRSKASSPSLAFPTISRDSLWASTPPMANLMNASSSTTSRRA